jgi:biopolymer transport protein ExbB
LSRLVLTALEHLDWPKAETVDCVQTRARQEVVQLERGLVVLEIITGIAPLLGLVGTLHGMITLFGDIGTAGLGDSNVVARGISITLNTTLMGLLIAIPSLIAWSYFSRRIESFAVEMETLLDEFLRRQYRAAEAPPPPPPTRPRPPGGRPGGRRSGTAPAEPPPAPAQPAPTPLAGS